MIRTQGTPRVLILIKDNQISPNMEKFYLSTDYIAYGLSDGNASVRKQILQDIQDSYDMSLFDCILCADTDMFKTITRKAKISGLEGYPVASDIGKVFWIPNYVSSYYNPEYKAKISFIMDKVNLLLQGKPITFGTDVLKDETYCYTYDEIKVGLNKLHAYDALTVDIETAGNQALKHYDNYLLSISFAWDKHSGVSIYINNDESTKSLLKGFFDSYQGTCIYHNCSFDIQNLIYHLYMSNLLDYEGMLLGLHTLCRNFGDTKLIAYLALNSCAGNKLGLKELSHEYTGNYAQENIADCASIPVAELLKYNLTDCCATWYVYEKYYPLMVADNQEDLYKSLFLPTQKVLLETQLVGFRIAQDRLESLNKEVQDKYEDLMNKLFSTSIIKQFNANLEDEVLLEYNLNKKKQRDIEYLRGLAGFKNKLSFNARSSDHKTRLLYKTMGLPVIDTTEKGAPATSRETLEKLLHACTTDEQKDILNILIELSGVEIIISNFLKTFNSAPKVEDNLLGIYGCFNLGGTVTGRLSSKEPNLTNMPSTGSVWAKPVKKIFTNPSGFIFVGADQRSLEDRISALTTKDENKCKVYLSHDSFILTINGKTQVITDDTLINYKGEQINGAELYTRLQSRKSGESK